MSPFIRDSLGFENHLYCECHCHHDKVVVIANVSPEKLIVLLQYMLLPHFLSTMMYSIRLCMASY